MSSTQEPAVSDGGLLRVRLDLAYDGTDFSGWAAQPGRRTVQGVVEQALAVVLGLTERVSLTVAGRTDSGVHARGQVAHADLPAVHAPLVGEPLRRRLDGALPSDVAVRAVAAAAAGFDARFSAVWRRYAYRVADSPAHVDPLRRDVLRHPRQLDLERLNAASRELVGLHDFAAFCRRREGATTVRELLELHWERDDTGLAVATVVADAFCHSMVRALVGALLPVGDGRREVGWPADVLAGRVRDSAVMVVAPYGLTLEEVRYPADADMLARAAQARRPRTVG